MKSDQQGFTLIELIVTVALSAMLLALAVPGISQMIQTNQRAVQLNEFVGALALSRNMAVSRNSRVSLCHSASKTTCDGESWADGWIVFEDNGASGAFEPLAGDTIIKQFAPVTEGISFATSDSYSTSVTYLTDGTVTESGELVVCDGRGADHARALCVGINGRPNVSEMACDGTALSCP